MKYAAHTDITIVCVITTGNLRLLASGWEYGGWVGRRNGEEIVECFIIKPKVYTEKEKINGTI